MPRRALIAVLLLAAAGTAAAVDPHMDANEVPGGCPACHAGHGAPGSPMLPAAQRQVCLRCHDTQAKADEEMRRGILATTATPRLLGANLAQPFTHPAGETSYSARQPGEVACTSCHSAHRRSPGRLVGADKASGRRVSTRDPGMLEFQMCQTCHGDQGARTQDRRDLSRLLNPNNVSFHPVEAPASNDSPSLLEGLGGTEIDCTDCHGNNDPDGPRGVHGSGVRYLLAGTYTTTDGFTESAERYALCYGCHEREAVLDSERFPLHRLHVVDAMASCATCHDPHGSPEQRALIRIGGDTTLAGITPSLAAGTLSFDSSVPGAGSCTLTCHGVDHEAASYGGAGAVLEGLRRIDPDDPRKRRPGLRERQPRRTPRRR